MSTPAEQSPRYQGPRWRAVERRRPRARNNSYDRPTRHDRRRRMRSWYEGLTVYVKLDDSATFFVYRFRHRLHGAWRAKDEGERPVHARSTFRTGAGVFGGRWWAGGMENILFPSVFFFYVDKRQLKTTTQTNCNCKSQQWREKSRTLKMTRRYFCTKILCQNIIEIKVLCSLVCAHITTFKILP